MYLKFVVLLFVVSKIAGLSPVQEIKGDIYIAILLKNCPNVTEPAPVPFELQSLASSALWTTQRINFLEIISPLKFGISIHEVCNGTAHFKTIFELYQKEEYLMGLITDERLNEKLLQFCDILDVRSTLVNRYNTFLVKASIQLLSAMGWIENVTIFIHDEHVAAEFFSYSKKEMICVKECVLYGSRCPAILNNSSPFVFFGYKHHFELLKKWQNMSAINIEDINGIFVPLDGSLPTDLPVNTFLIVPPHELPDKVYNVPENILPTPSFFEVANPILTYVKNIENFVISNCNGTINPLTCIREKYKKMYRPVLMTPSSILSTLKIDTLQQDFIYNIYQIDNETNTTEFIKKNNLFQPLTKVFEYSIFGNNLTVIDTQFEPIDSINFSTFELNKECISFFSRTNVKYVLDQPEVIAFRSESWVFAFLSLSLLGALFCIAILIFVLVCIFRRDILEGNPLLTLALLLAVMLLFCSVLPFSVEYNKYTRYPLCLLKSLSVTLGYALVFSLLLSRCILLATASKELGFMSHIAGPVQSFLCLFIFGVQAALSLQLLSKCYEIFRNHSFVYLMSYNTMLLLLLLCLCPLIFKCQRNYREGKYFTIAIILTNCVWFVWVPLYALLDEDWQEPLLCFGLVSTASIFLGAIFIPRTYLMTIAAARNKITSTLPSLATATSAIDIYRGSNQPIYDCVNVAAINAVAVARAGVTAPTPTLQRPDLYSCPALPEDEELDFRCDSPTDDDKVTRF